MTEEAPPPPEPESPAPPPRPSWLLGWARLLRLPNCLTSVADVLAGAAAASVAYGTVTPEAIAGMEPPAPAAEFQPGILLLALFASPLLYGAGCVLNDWADLPKDRIDKPERPLPSGVVSPTGALFGTALLLTAALGLGTVAGTPVLLVLIGMTFAVLAYDLGLKRFPLPGLAMLVGARFGNVLLGAVAYAGGLPLDAWFWIAPIGLGVYIAGLSGISIFEDRNPGRFTILVVGLIAPAVVVTLAGLSRHPWLAAGPAALAAATMGWALVRALKDPTPKHCGLYVRAAVLGVPLYDAVIAFGANAWGYGLVILGLAAGARLLARRIAT